MKGPVPETDYTVPFGVADIKREGKDVTIVALSWMVQKSLAAAEELAKAGISAEVIDPRTLVPLDKKRLIDSIKKTGRLVTVEEGCRTGGVGAEIAAIVASEAFDYLDAPIKRVAIPDLLIPYAPENERLIIPDAPDIVRAVKEIV
jgi:pyruvate/2-oxoglutarate/acetoin dehydrogenase E1 component